MDKLPGNANMIVSTVEQEPQQEGTETHAGLRHDTHIEPPDVRSVQVERKRQNGQRPVYRATFHDNTKRVPLVGPRAPLAPIDCHPDAPRDESCGAHLQGERDHCEGEHPVAEGWIEYYAALR